MDRYSRLVPSLVKIHVNTKSGSKVPNYSLFNPASVQTSRIKQRNRSENTKDEVLLRQRVWRLGIRYGLHDISLPGKPDIVFRRAKVAVFCDGDFWHGRNWRKRKMCLLKGTNAAYWVPKIQANIERDRRQTAKLRKMGWRVLRFWETDILRDPDRLAEEVRNAVCKTT